MKVHLIKSSELDTDMFTRVFDLLTAVPGTIKFYCDPASLIEYDEDEILITSIPSVKDFEKSMTIASYGEIYEIRSFPMERETVSWDTLFKKCATYRRANSISQDSFVILLTDKANKQNWFACLDERMPYNGFIHTDDWDHFIDCPPEFPIAYEVLALMLQKHIFDGHQDLREAVHNTPVGCVSDMCMQKNEIILKLRTADVCKGCMDRIKNKLPATTINHALDLMESLRVKMLFAQNFRQRVTLSRLIIDERHKIMLPDFGHLEVKLRPLEKCLYILFLQHPDGIYISSLSEHRQELYTIYENISHTGTREEMRQRIDELVNVLSNSASEKISRIKRAFELAIGEELAKHYYIQGGNGERKKIEGARACELGVELS